jgi:RimJ/RimL family protein N-acetyltransferase
VSAVNVQDKRFRVIETPRLSLHPLQQSDAVFYTSLFTDSELMRQIGAPLTREAADAAFWTTMKMMQGVPPRAWLWRAEERGSCDIVGLVGIVMHQGMPEIGSIIVTSQQLRGYAYESLAAVRDTGFQALGLVSLFGRQQQENQRSIGLMTKLGFRQVPGLTGRIHWRMDRDDLVECAGGFLKPAPAVRT